MVTKRPTTTGGRPIPVLIRLTTILLPGNLVSATRGPDGYPEEEADQGCNSRNLKRKEGNTENLRVKCDQKPEGFFDSFENEVHIASPITNLYLRKNLEILIHALQGHASMSKNSISLPEKKQGYRSWQICSVNGLQFR